MPTQFRDIGPRKITVAMAILNVPKLQPAPLDRCQKLYINDHVLLSGEARFLRALLQWVQSHPPLPPGPTCNPTFKCGALGARRVTAWERLPTCMLITFSGAFWTWRAGSKGERKNVSIGGPNPLRPCKKSWKTTSRHVLVSDREEHNTRSAHSEIIWFSRLLLKGGREAEKLCWDLRFRSHCQVFCLLDRLWCCWLLGMWSDSLAKFWEQTLWRSGWPSSSHLLRCTCLLHSRSNWLSHLDCNSWMLGCLEP